MDTRIVRISGEAAGVTAEEEVEDTAAVEAAAAMAASAMAGDIVIVEDTVEVAGGAEEDGAHDATVDELLMNIVLRILLSVDLVQYEGVRISHTRPAVQTRNVAGCGTRYLMRSQMDDARRMISFIK